MLALAPLLSFRLCADAPLPYRFLLVISRQWQDPASYVIEGGGEFPLLAALMKTSGLPYEIFRLDQQRLDKYQLLDRDGRPRFGTTSPTARIMTAFSPRMSPPGRCTFPTTPARR